MKEELKEINRTLEKIENKIENKSSPYSWMRNLTDLTKMQEESRKEREEKRNQELLEIHKIQTESMKKQEKFTSIVAFTGSILALIGIYGFLNSLVLQKASSSVFWIVSLVFLLTMILCLGPLTAFVINYYKKWILGK
jgi:cation transport ATPase